MKQNNSILTFNDDNNFWIVRAEGGKYFDDFLDDKYIGIRYNKVTIKSLIENKDDLMPSVDTVKNVYKAAYNNRKPLNKSSKQKLTEHAKQSYLFTFEMKIGDIVLVPNKNSKHFALGVVISKPYDESENHIKERKANYCLKAKPSNYIKRRKINWISIIYRKDIPDKLSWILSTHQTIINASSAREQLMPLVYPIFKYNDKYYLRVFSNKGENLTLKDWSMLVDSNNSNIDQRITLKADIHSPGFLYFITPNLHYFYDLIINWGIPTIGIINYLMNLIVGKKKHKRKGYRSMDTRS